jgi:hypothetical protein
MTTHRVVIRSHDGSYEHVIATGKSDRAAERVAMGAEINMNHDGYRVDIEPEETT